jgi:membrane protein
VGLFNLDASALVFSLEDYLPDVIYNLVLVFVDEVIYQTHIGYMTLSIFLCLYLTSGGFNAVVIGFNNIYGREDNRSPVIIRIISCVLVLIFTTLVILFAVLFVFSAQILSLVFRFLPESELTMLMSTYIGYGIAFTFIFFSIIFIYRISLGKNKLSSFIPGSLFTVVVWTIISKAFNFYINNYANFSMIYGSIAGLFILMFWLKLISVSMILGSCINAEIDFLRTCKRNN